MTDILILHNVIWDLMMKENNVICTLWMVTPSKSKILVET